MMQDRTGVLTMLLLSAAGVGRAAIVEDYSRSGAWMKELEAEFMHKYGDIIGTSLGTRDIQPLFAAESVSIEQLLVSQV